MMLRTIQVRLPAIRDRAYAIQIAPGLFARVPQLLVRQWKSAVFHIIADSTVSRLYGGALRRAVQRLGAKALLYEFPAGEESKCQAVADALHTALLTEQIRRQDLVVALGGGVTGDLAGYVAATILRGVQFVQVPTTLLSQVDSSVGGKVGIDHPLGKNLVGAFHQPRAVFVDPHLLGTLPLRQFRSGVAEILKIALALDGRLYRDMERHVHRLNPGKEDFLAGVISRAISLKAAVVTKDGFESGLRKSLNLGHTIGHAVEAASSYSLLHGEAVAIGMACEARLSRELGLMTEEETRRLLTLLKKVGLPTTIPRSIERGAVRKALQLDKKGEGAVIKFVLPAGAGRCAIGMTVPDHILAEVV